MKQLACLAAAALFLTMNPAVPARADSTLVFKVAVQTTSPKSPRATIYAGSTAVITLVGREWQSVSDAEEVARRLNVLAEEGARPDDFRVERERVTQIIVARGRPIVRIDRDLAAAHRSDAASLARVWRDNLRSQFGRPYLSAPPVVVPVGEQRTVRVRGNIVGDLTVRAAAPVVSATWDKAARTVRVEALQAGRTEVVLQDKHSLLELPVRAAKYAARLGASLSAAVTGNPAPVDVLTSAVEAAVGASLVLEPGAWASISPWVKEAAPLAAGKSAVVPVCVSAAGEEHIPCSLRPVVTVRNQPIPLDPVEVLMVSNSPERLRTHGLWFEGKLQDHRSARFLYHHVNAAGSDSDMLLELWNLGDRTAYVHVIAGTGGPVRDESWAGHRATSQFLYNRQGQVGWVVPVPPRTAVPVVARPITPNATASGVFELRSLEPADLSVRLYLLPRRTLRLPHPINKYVPSPLLGKWLYPGPRREVSAAYTVGREWAFITIGDQAARGLVEGDHLPGSYGVIYEIALELINPTAEPAPVAIAIESAGGPARATLLVDRQRIETAVIKGHSDALVARYLLAPGERRMVRIETMPQAGSNYPVRLMARPA